MNHSPIKDLLYEQVARIGKALSSPRRLELLEMLAQGEKTVDALAQAVGMDIKLTSAHLKALRDARLVDSRRDGKYIAYRLAGDDVSRLGLALREVAQEHLVELQLALQGMAAEPEGLASMSPSQLLAQARRGAVVVLDVRPDDEYAHAHLPHARSIPLAELKRRLRELPRDKAIVAYCRGPYCLMSDEAVQLLKSRGYQARKITLGVTEWQAAGLPLAHSG